MFKSSAFKRKREAGTVTSWIETTFSRRDCSRFLPSVKDNARCCCGNLWQWHSDGSPATLQHTTKGDDHWNPLRHTTLHPTNAYGTIEFQGGGHPSKAQYARVAFDTRAELVMQLLVSAWRLELPKLLITVQGGKANFELQPKLKKALRRGLLKAARTTGAWVFTGGTNTGVTRHAGDALSSGQSQRPGAQRAVCIGIAPWGVIEGRQEQLVGRNREVPYHMAQGRFRCAPLNSRHTHFILADNGTAGRYGAEYVMRRALEKHISNQRVISRLGQGIPLVCVVIEGGINTVRSVLEYVTDTPPVPVVVCDGTGRASDIIAFVHKHMHSESGGDALLEAAPMREHLVATVEQTFAVRREQAERLLAEVVQCCRHRELITIYRYQEGLELDEAMLKALLKGYHMCGTDQLNLALSWNRVDIARSTVFAAPHDWPPGSLEQAMMDALVGDRTDFVNLLLENGVIMSSFLTLARLEELYNAKQGPPNSLHYIIQDVRPGLGRGGRYTLIDIGLAINRLMGGAYRCTYSRRKFRALYYETFHLRSPAMVRNTSAFLRQAACASAAVAAGTPVKLLTSLPTNGHPSGQAAPASDPARPLQQLFEYPFSELMIWAVLTKRQAMARLMWQHGEEALAKALVACKLYRALAHEAADDNLETEFFEELKRHSREFEDLALEVLDFVYQHSQDVAQQLLTYELRNWSRQTCLSLAVVADHKRLLAHPSCQVLLAELWMGGLSLRRNANLKVLLALLLPPAMLRLEFRTQEELRQMPQTEEEFLMEHADDEDDGSDDDDDENGGGDNVRSPSLRRLSPTRQASVPSSGDPATPTALPELLDGRKNNQLAFRKKVYEFYTAPVTKFWSFTLAYLVFLTFYTFVVLVRMYPTPRWQEVYVTAFIATLGIEKCREILKTEPVTLSQKLSHWFHRLWNMCDAFFIATYLMAQPLRFQPETFRLGRVFICCNNMYWQIRLFEIFSVEKYLGPMVTMVGKMLVKMMHFIVLLVILLFSFGVLRQAIRFPNSDPNWYLLRHVFYQPYFMLYGEVYAPEIEPAECGDGPGQEACEFWITVVAMTAYLIVANILMLNLMIAVFNNIFAGINAVAHEVWMFQRYRLVMEYELRPVCPPPFIVLSHIFMLIKFCVNQCRRDSSSYDRGLKLFLDEGALENVHDFEEECLEEYLLQKEYKAQHATDRLIQQGWERQEQCYQRLEDVLQREKSQAEATRLLDYRLKRLEEALLGVEGLARATHQMVRQYTGLAGSEPEGLERPERQRQTSAGSDDAAGGAGGQSAGEDTTDGRRSTMVQELARIALQQQGPRRRRSRSGGARPHRLDSSCSSSSSSSSRSSTSGGPISIGGGTALPAPAPVSADDEPREAEPPAPPPPPRRTLSAPATETAPAPRGSRPEIHVLPPPRDVEVELALPLEEYRSITDVLESRCRAELGPVLTATPLPPQPSSPGTQRHLTSAEDGDYQMMEQLIQRRMRRPSENLDHSLEDLARLVVEYSPSPQRASLSAQSSLAPLAALREDSPEPLQPEREPTPETPLLAAPPTDDAATTADPSSQQTTRC